MCSIQKWIAALVITIGSSFATALFVFVWSDHLHADVPIHGSRNQDLQDLYTQLAVIPCLPSSSTTTPAAGMPSSMGPGIQISRASVKSMDAFCCPLADSDRTKQRWTKKRYKGRCKRVYRYDKCCEKKNGGPLDRCRISWASGSRLPKILIWFRDSDVLHWQWRHQVLPRCLRN